MRVCLVAPPGEFLRVKVDWCCLQVTMCDPLMSALGAFSKTRYTNRHNFTNATNSVVHWFEDGAHFSGDRAYKLRCRLQCIDCTVDFTVTCDVYYTEVPYHVVS